MRSTAGWLGTMPLQSMTFTTWHTFSKSNDLKLSSHARICSLHRIKRLSERNETCIMDCLLQGKKLVSAEFLPIDVLKLNVSKNTYWYSGAVRYGKRTEQERLSYLYQRSLNEIPLQMNSNFRRASRHWLSSSIEECGWALSAQHRRQDSYVGMLNNKPLV